MKGPQKVNIKAVRLSPILLAVAGSLIIAACGSSSSTGSTHTSTTASTSSSRTKLAACLKQHGITLPSRPAGGHGGFFGGGGPPGGGAGGAPGTGGQTTSSGTRPPGAGAGGGGFFRNPKFQAAFKACGGAQGSFGGGRFRRPHFSTALLTSFATCVRKHGYNLPKPNTSGKGAIFPRSIESNPKFVKASRSCASILRPSTTTTTGGSSS